MKIVDSCCCRYEVGRKWDLVSHRVFLHVEDVSLSCVKRDLKMDGVIDSVIEMSERGNPPTPP